MLFIIKSVMYHKVFTGPDGRFSQDSGLVIKHIKKADKIHYFYNLVEAETIKDAARLHITQMLLGDSEVIYCNGNQIRHFGDQVYEILKIIQINTLADLAKMIPHYRNRDSGKEIIDLAQELNISESWAADILYFRKRRQHTPALENQLIELAKENKEQINIFDWPE